MKIAVDYQSAQGKRTGIGVAARCLVEAMERLRPEWCFLRYTVSGEKDLNTPGRVIWESIRIPVRAAGDRPDWVYSPGFAPAWASPCRRLVTVHDLIGMIYPNHLPPAARVYWSRWLPACVRRAERVVASSESTKKDMMRLIGIPEKKIRVVPLAANDAYLKPAECRGIARRWSLDKPYLVTVGTLEPRKNLARLIDAMARLKARGEDVFQIAVVGKGGGEEVLLKNRVKSEGLDSSIRFLGYLTDEEIRELYDSAIGYAMVSLYEGFGLPVLEAMRCGRAGVLSEVSSLPEVARDSAVYVNPQSEDSIAEGLAFFVSNAAMREKLSERALRIARSFSWEASARRMIEIFEEVE